MISGPSIPAAERPYEVGQNHRTQRLPRRGKRPGKSGDGNWYWWRFPKSWGYPMYHPYFRLDLFKPHLSSILDWEFFNEININKPSSDKGVPPWLWKPPHRERNPGVSWRHRRVLPGSSGEDAEPHRLMFADVRGDHSPSSMGISGS